MKMAANITSAGKIICLNLLKYAPLYFLATRQNHKKLKVRIILAKNILKLEY